MATTGLEVQEEGRALRVQAEVPHLVSMGSGRLSTAVTLHPLPEGKVILGSNRDADIPIAGTGVELTHCAIENNNGVVTLYPINGTTAVDGTPISSPFKLVQGCMVSIGRSNYMRFNNPAEAKQLRSVLPHSRISMAPISFSVPEDDQLQDGNTRHNLEKKPPVAPRKSPRNSCSDDEIGFLGKLTKFEMLAKQNRNNCVSPKVFPAGGLTTNVPADQIFGYARSSSLTSLTKCNKHGTTSPLQNLTNLNRNRSKTPNLVNSQIHEEQHHKSNNRPSVRLNSSNHRQNCTPNQLQLHNTPAIYLKTYNKPCYQDDNNENNQTSPRNSELMTKSMVCQRSSELEQLETRDYDMSQSLIVTKTTTTEFLQLEKHNSNPSICAKVCASSMGNGQNFEPSPIVKKLQPSSVSYNRNPKYTEQKKCQGRVKSPTPSVGSNCSLEELKERQLDAVNKRKEAECKRKQAQEDRLKEQEVEKLEKMRLEEILTMCAEYEKQSIVEKPKQPNRIITNGSLPREKRLGGYGSPFESQKNTSKNQPPNCFETTKQKNHNSSSYENVCVKNGLVKHTDVPNIRLSMNGQPVQNDKDHSFFGSISQVRNPNYENVAIVDNCAYAQQNHDSISEGSYGTIQLNGTKISSQNYENLLPVKESLNLYENVAIQQNNNNNIHSMPKTNEQLLKSCEIIENKLIISNNDLLETIEQLSVISKSKEMLVTPKKNNIECSDKSNEIKANKKKRENEEEGKKKYIEFLENEKLHILGNMDGLKRSVADIEIQEEEISRELELEKALLSAEYESESLKLTQDESEKIRIQMRINELEREMAVDNTTQANLQAAAKQGVQQAQQVYSRLEEELANCTDEMKHREIVEKLTFQQEILESERKSFEDLEFHHLEEEARKLATREELQRYLSEITSWIKNRKIQLDNLSLQRNEITNTVTKEAKSLERQKLGHLKKLEEGRNRLRAINDELNSLTRNAFENSEEKRSPSREDFDRISRVTNDSPIVNVQGSLGRKTIESLREIERNRQLHLAKQGSQVISEERRRVEELKRRVQDEVRSQWEERKMNCVSFNSVESGEESSSYSTGPTESGSGSSDGAEGGMIEKLSPSKLTEINAPSPGPSTNSYNLIQNDAMRDDRRTSTEGERYSTTSGGILDNSGSRPLSQTSSEMDALGPLQPVKHRDKAKLQRPLTRYLPIKSESLDLRHHIETAGHQLPLIYDVNVDKTSCSGYLSKMSKKFHHWNKRWFIFDRKTKTLSYYSDSSSRKPRGIIYFQAIEEVYVDHMNTVKSPQPSLTFIIKTSSRPYHLMTPSAEAMRVWVDVVFTGAEGYHEFDHGV